MNAGHFTLLVALLGFTLQAQAGQTGQQVDLRSCTLHTRTIQGPADTSGPRFLMMSGVPLSGAVFKPLCEQLSTRLAATSTFIDFPGVGGSALKAGRYGMQALRTCLREYLATQPANLFVGGDLAMPVDRRCSRPVGSG